MATVIIRCRRRLDTCTSKREGQGAEEGTSRRRDVDEDDGSRHHSSPSTSRRQCGKERKNRLELTITALLTAPRGFSWRERKVVVVVLWRGGKKAGGSLLASTRCQGKKEGRVREKEGRVWKITYWSLSIDRAGPRRHIRIASFAVALEGRRVGSALGFRILIGRQLGEQATTTQDRREHLERATQMRALGRYGGVRARRW